MKLISFLFLAPIAASAATNLRRRAQSATCSESQLKDFACSLPGGLPGALICTHGFTACLAPEDHKFNHACGECPEVELETEPPRLDPVDEKGPRCGDVKLSDLACPLSNGSTGALVCHNGFSACRSLLHIDDDDTCGCCPGDDSPKCSSSEVKAVGSTESTAKSSVCSEAELTKFSCALGDGSTGALVCAAGFTACLRPETHRAYYTCGVCPVTEPEEIRQPEVVEPKPLCSLVNMDDFACALADGSTGVLACHSGFSACLQKVQIEDDHSCGCCPGDDSDKCGGK